MRERGGDGFAEGGVHPEHPDPLRQFPRLMQPHRGDDTSFRFMTDPRVAGWLTGLLGAEPYAVQTMVYFKPPGARGQALHQDQRYLRVEPGTCVAAWLALDPCDEENGCLTVVPGSQDLPVLCPVPLDSDESFTTETVPVPAGLTPEMVPMDAGDVLFFNGSLIHGSPPNRSDRFRRIIVGHYIVGEAEAVGRYYHPVYRMDGSIAELAVSSSDAPCGIFTDVERERLEMSGTIAEALKAH
jgi:ectoine hydroxylase-related dioxygenase (phytanoyl-CoA dioxygenase family)